MSAWIPLCWVIAVLPSRSMDEATGHCDLVEINHCHDRESGELKFVQVIAWEWMPDYQRYNVHQWAMVSDWKRNAGEVVVDLADTDRVLRLRCKYFHESWSNSDPERTDAQVFPEKHRRRIW